MIAYRRQQRKEQIELLSTRVPLKLSGLMDSDNAAAAVRAALALEDLNNQGQAEPLRRINTGGIVIMLGSAQWVLPSGPIAEPLDLEAIEND